MNHSSIYVHSEDSSSDMTMPGKRDRKPNGRFVPGDMILNRYKVLSELGQGGMGIAYKCFDETAGIEIALKALPPELSHNSLEMEEIKENFQLIHKLHHPNIAASNNLERDSATGNYYLIMECCDGEDLRHWIRRKRKNNTLDLAAINLIVRQVADALDYAHAQNIVHRDIKPGNIMVGAAGDVKILDFGLAAQIHNSMSRISMAYHGVSGTGPYMSPEQWRGRAQGAAADQYALGVTTYEMISGHLPFENPDPAVLQQIVLTQKAEKLPAVPQYVQHAVDKAMSKDPANRFSSCNAFADALENKITIPAFSRNVFRKWVPAISLVLIFLIASAGFAYYSRYRKKAAEKAQPSANFKNGIEKRRSTENLQTAEPQKNVEKQVPKEKQPPQVIVREDIAKDDAEAVKSAAEIRKQQSIEVQLENMEKIKREEQFKRENYQLLADLEEIRQRINTVANKENFPKRMDSFNKYLSIAHNAFNRNEHAVAGEFFRKALDEARFIQSNGEIIGKCIKYKRTLTVLKGEANRKNVSHWAASDYAAAEKVLNSAEEQLRNEHYSGSLQMFQQAQQQLQQAIKAAEQAQVAARNNKIRDHLKAGKAAILAKDMPLLQQAIVQLEKLAPEHPELPELRRQMDRGVAPVLKLLILTEGQELPAKVLFDNSGISGAAGNVFRGFSMNNTYSCLIVTEKDGKKFVQPLKFRCNWQGEKKITVNMKEFNMGALELAPGITLKMVKIKAGSFTMGSPPGKGLFFEGKERGRSSNETLHEVTISKDFWIGKYEVSQEQYQLITGSNPSMYRHPQHPVENVSWFHARDFCEMLNRKYAAFLPAGYKFALPTEAQWEYACRAGTQSALNNGTQLNLSSRRRFCSNLDKLGWFSLNSGRKNHQKIGLKEANAWGLHDMHGNVMEWCSDWYDDLQEISVTDPAGPGRGNKRVLRGGSWGNHPHLCRSASRTFQVPSNKNCYIGFRVAVVPAQ